MLREAEEAAAAAAWLKALWDDGMPACSGSVVSGTSDGATFLKAG